MDDNLFDFPNFLFYFCLNLGMPHLVDVSFKLEVDFQLPEKIKFKEKNSALIVRSVNGRTFFLLNKNDFYLFEEKKLSLKKTQLFAQVHATHGSMI